MLINMKDVNHVTRQLDQLVLCMYRVKSTLYVELYNTSDLMYYLARTLTQCHVVLFKTKVHVNTE